MRCSDCFRSDGNGAHKTQMEAHRASPLFDRSSFTRTRIAASQGTGGGSNPMDEL